MRDHPRLRGEYLLLLRLPLGCGGSPPLTRGIHSVDDGQQQPHGITPAYAGNTRWSLMTVAQSRDHPRLRGEYYQLLWFRQPVPGSPPLTRGIQSALIAYSVPLRITPAYAGNTESPPTSFQVCWDHPRLRGEYASIPRYENPCLGSPPLTRGIQSPFWASACAARITPAYAGNTSPHSASCSDSWDHPRLRGEYCYK